MSQTSVLNYMPKLGPDSVKRPIFLPFLPSPPICSNFFRHALGSLNIMRMFFTNNYVGLSRHGLRSTTSCILAQQLQRGVTTPHFLFAHFLAYQASCPRKSYFGIVKWQFANTRNIFFPLRSLKQQCCQHKFYQVLVLHACCWPSPPKYWLPVGTCQKLR